MLDIINKLKISPNDSILDIGSGVGTITILVSLFCEKITTINHPECLKRMRKRCDGIQNIDYLPGNFLI